MADELPTSLQESLLALLMFDKQFGSAVAAQVKPQHFDGPYQEVATRILNYRSKYGKPPGRAQLDDLFGWALERGEKAPRLKRLMTGIVALSEGLNPEYVASRTQNFIREQTLNSAIVEAAERYQAGGEDRVPDVEKILYDALKAKQYDLDAGTFLNDFPKALRFFDTTAVTYPIGILELDNAGIGGTLKEMLLYIGSKGSGKTWFCVHMGVQGLLNRNNVAKVLHISLEWGEEKIAGRYYQRIFNASWKSDEYKVVEFDFDEDTGALSGFRTRTRKPRLVLSSEEGRRLLEKKLKPWGTRFGRIVIKQFPTRQLTMTMLRTYLDYLDASQKFIPTMVIVDYPDLMKLDSRNYRIELGRVYEELRGLAVERSFALIAPTQGGRQTIGAKKVNSTDVAEDITKVNTADSVLTYSQTVAEKRNNRARLYVPHARSVEGGQSIAITQAYSVGQYVLSSAFMSNNYWEILRRDDPEAIDEE